MLCDGFRCRFRATGRYADVVWYDLNGRLMGRFRGSMFSAISCRARGLASGAPAIFDGAAEIRRIGRLYRL